MTPDPQLIQDAHDAALSVVAILESETPTCDQVRSAFWFSQKATGKLNEAVCRFSGQSRKEERG